MAIHYRAEYPATPELLLGILTNKEFLKDYATEFGALSHEAKVKEKQGVWSIHLHLVAPTDEVPKIFKRFVGSEVVIDDRRVWSADENGGYRCKIHVEATMKGRTATIRGDLTLAPSRAGTEFLADADVNLELKLIGGQARAAIAELCTESFGDETTVLLRWLDRANAS